MRHPILPLILSAIFVVGAAQAVGAQQSPAPVARAPEVLTPAVRAEVVDSVASKMARFYALEETGRRIADRLRARLRSGAYDAITKPALLAEALTTDILRIHDDRHLSVSLQSPGVPLVPPGVATLPTPGSGPGTPAPVPPQVLEAARRNNFNLGRVEVLPGNVGYFEIRAFSPMLEATEAVVKALRYLEHTDAIIFDVRHHVGGSADLSNFLISHFTGPDTLHSLDLEIRAANYRGQRWTLAQVPGPRRPDVPVYILTSRGTVSAGEDFAFVMKNLGRATLLGENTQGAGRNNPSFDVGHGFAASISVSTVKDPATGTEWEGVGVIPHIRVPPRTALGVAHALALKNLAETPQNTGRRGELELTREYVEAQARAHVVPASTLMKYVGIYGGERTITVENGKLVFRRMPGRLGEELVPLSDSTFALGPVVRLAFDTGPTGSLRLRSTMPSGDVLVFERTGPPPAIPSEYR